MSIVDKLNTIKACKEDIKQAISDKGVDMSDVAFTEYATKISEIQQGGGSGDFIEIRNNLTTYSNSNIEEIPSSSFFSMSKLTTVNLPNTITIGSNAFSYAGLTTVNIPKCTDIKDYSFEYCFQLTDIDFHNVINIGYSAFQWCNNLTKSLNNLPFLENISGWAFYDCNITSIDVPTCREIGEYAFANNDNLTSINLPECKRLGGASFEYCYALTDINLPKCESLDEGNFREIPATSIDLPSCRNVGTDTFARCPNLTEVNIPVVDIIWYNSFVDCSNLTTINASQCTEIHSEAFARTALNSLDLSKSFYCMLEDINAFSETPIENGEGTIYVHNAHIDAFRNDTNWSYFADRFVGVGDADKPILAFADGVLYGEITSLTGNFKNLLGIDNSNLTEIDLSNCDKITQYYFMDIDSLTTVNLPKCKIVEYWAFHGCDYMTTLNLPECEEIRGSAFEGISVTTLDLPKCKIVGGSAFQYARQLTTVNLPECEEIGNNAFGDCSSLTEINLPKCSRLGYDIFGSGDFENDCVLYIGTELDVVCELNGWLAYNNYSGNLKTIYVPQALVEDYKNAPNWCDMADKIVGI